MRIELERGEGWCEIRSVISQAKPDDRNQASAILGAIYSFQLLSAYNSSEAPPKVESVLNQEADLTRFASLPQMSVLTQSEIRGKLEELRDDELVEYNDGGTFRLKPAGREMITVVLTGGAFDIIHPGHVETLQKAKSLGDVLVVSVARNATYARNRKKSPLHDETLRRDLVQSLKSVDAAILGSSIDIFETVLSVRPDIIALGYDQSHNEDGLRREIERRKIECKIVRLDSSVPSIKSSKIINEFY